MVVGGGEEDSYIYWVELCPSLTVSLGSEEDMLLGPWGVGLIFQETFQAGDVLQPLL